MPLIDFGIKARREAKQMRRELRNLETQYEAFKATRRGREALVKLQGEALRSIADQATPSANATVKRMARIAEDALRGEAPK